MTGALKSMDEQSVTLLPFNAVNYILSIAAGNICPRTVTVKVFFLFFPSIHIGSKFMKFQ
jgi:hypothetical protein